MIWNCVLVEKYEEPYMSPGTAAFYLRKLFMFVERGALRRKKSIKNNQGKMVEGKGWKNPRAPTILAHTQMNKRTNKRMNECMGSAGMTIIPIYYILHITYYYRLLKDFRCEFIIIIRYPRVCVNVGNGSNMKAIKTFYAWIHDRRTVLGIRHNA